MITGVGDRPQCTVDRHRGTVFVQFPSNSRRTTMDHQNYARPKPNSQAQRRNCCVPQCSERKNSSTRLHVVPTDPLRRMQGAVKIKTGKALSATMRVCSKHFLKDDYISSVSSRPSLKKTATPPSQNLPVRSHEVLVLSPVQRKQAKRADRARKRSERACGSESGAVSYDSTGDNSTSSDPDDNNNEWMDLGEVEMEDVEKFKSLGTQVGTYDHNEAFVNSILSDSGKLFSATGLYSVKFLNSLVIAFDEVAPENPKKKFNLSTRNRILLTMMKLKLSLYFSSLAVFFDTSIQNACNYFYDSVRILAQILKCMVEWHSKELIMQNMPKCFSHFKKTRVVLDCFELSVEKPKCVRCRVLLYSQYKKGYTLKLLLCCAPSGLITKVSQAYGGRASDKFITAQSEVYGLCEFGDAIMVDKGFAIEEQCSKYLLTMIRPPFMKKKGKFTRAEALQCANIARARVHVERTIQRVREYGILKNKLPWRLVPYFNDIVLIVCALVNLGAPILAADKYPE